MEIKQNKYHKKKIVFKISEFPHVSETFIIAQVITAIQLNYQVVILVNRVLDFKQSLQEDIILKHKLNELIIVEDVKIPKNKITRFLKIFYLFVLNLSCLSNILNFYKFQKEKSFSWIFYWVFYKQFDDSNTVFHIQYGNNKSPIDVLKAKCNFKSKVITTFHGHDAFFPINGIIPNDGYYDLLFESADIISVNTKYLADKIEQLGCPTDKLKIIPVGVDTDYFNSSNKLQHTNPSLKLITVGRLTVVKGHIYAFEVVKKLRMLGYNIELIVVGEGSERINLENYIKNNNLSDSINLVGSKSRKQIRELHWKSDVFLFTSVSLHFGNSTETQGLATLEAQACGLPVLVYDSGGVKYTIKENVTGFIFNEFEIDKVVEKLLFLNENRAVIQEMSNNCFRFVDENFSQKVINEKWSNIYSNL